MSTHTGGDINIDSDSGPTILLNRIGRIATYEVQEMELERLDALVAEENQAFGFAAFMAGIFIPTLIGWLTADKAVVSAKATGIYVGVLVTSFILTLWFGRTWWRTRKERPKLLNMVRERSRIGEKPDMKSLPGRSVT